MKFRKKPVVIEAVQFLENDASINAITKLAAEGTRRVDLLTMDGAYPQLFIETLEGRMEARIGDWIIKGVSGELYPCKPDIFAATYEPAEDDNDFPLGQACDLSGEGTCEACQ